MRIVMYTLSTCPWCKKSKDFFRERGVPFDYIDYDLAEDDVQERIAEDVYRRGHQLSFPIVIIDDVVVAGYNPERYKMLLER